MENFVIIEDGDGIIGKEQELVKYLLCELAKNLNDKDMEIEEKVIQLNAIQEVVNDLEENYYPNDVLKLADNPMGGFVIYYMVEEKE